jgi:hypothetical protein
LALSPRGSRCAALQLDKVLDAGQIFAGRIQIDLTELRHVGLRTTPQFLVNVVKKIGRLTKPKNLVGVVRPIEKSRD